MAVLSPDLRRRLRRVRERPDHWADWLANQMETAGAIVPVELSPEIDYVDGNRANAFIQQLDDALFTGVSNTRAAQCGTLVVGGSVPESLRRHLESAKNCFTVGLYEPSVVFCRAIVEMAAFQFLRARKDPPRGVSPFEERIKLAALLKNLREWGVSAKILSAAETVMDRAGGILHAKNQPQIIGPRLALDVLKRTYACVEALWDLP